MTTFTDRQIARLCYDHGWRGGDLVTAVEVVLAESGGNSQAHNTRPPDDSYGLFQINMYGTLGPARRAAWHLSSDAALLDPGINASAAWSLYLAAGRRFTDWSTYLHGTTAMFASRATAAVSAITAAMHGGVVLKRYLLYRHPMESGSDVRACQAIVGCKTDGLFGPITHGHVITWQRAHHILVDGIVGPQTASTFHWTWAGPK